MSTTILDNQDLLAGAEDQALLESLRVSSWTAFQGQRHIKQSLSIALEAAKNRGEAVDHILLYGPPGLGKTTLSHLVAKEMDSQIVVTSGTALIKTADLAAVLTNLAPQSVLFVDEIHRLKKPLEEMLYIAMEDFALDIIIGQGPSARTVRLDLPHFTLVGATTRFGSLSGPFRDRFGVVHRMEYYQPDELVDILMQAGTTLGITLNEEVAFLLAKSSRGTPRIALKLLKRLRDFSQVMHQGTINADITHAALNLHHIDELGLTDTDRRYLQLLIKNYDGGPAGLSTLAAALNEDPVTIEEVIEPYLLQIGFIQKTSQGRLVTGQGRKHDEQ